MRRLAVLLLFSGCITASTQQKFDPALLRQIDARIQQGIADQKYPGGVYHLEQGDKVYENMYGNRALVPAVERMTVDTIFDAASITKVVATTPAIWLLIQRGKIGIDDPVQKFIPEFPHPDMTIRHLLTHTSGLRPDLDLREPWSGYDTAMQLILKEELMNEPGYVFRYSDINFELLGEIVRRVSGEPLDVFAEKEIFEPLGMTDTGFRRVRADFSRPAEAGPTLGRIAPTEMTDGVMLRGVVHDPTARRMGGVAGHAGLFITVHDLAKYCRMLLRGGSPIFRPEIVQQMTSVQSPPDVAVKRAGGFDIDSSYSKPRGEMFPIGSYGHTGFTGGFFWIDPQSKTFFIFLSNRVHPYGKGNVVSLQHDLGALSARAVGYTTPVYGRVRWPWFGADAQNGIDVLVARRYEPLRGLRIGLITNQTAIDRAGNPTIDLLRSAPGVTLVSLFSPEHGIRGVEDTKVSDTTDSVSGLPIHSLYGEARKPKPEQLADIDALVYDVQDIGCRFYTYTATMGLALEAAAESKKKFIILDRVDPIGGADVEGPILKGETDFVGWHPIPIRYGMTIGELAQMYRDELHLDVDLQIIEVRGWSRPMWQDEAGLPWINTSPNMRSLTEAGLYPGIGLMESALSVGRGTATP
ncbi:MAG TPA: exo-beta-N-acetylmuramidase NamZ domain-containing protein, partial [Thermoanaerobaculia bacterium]|nr:exo-beta-N-acetylmuramidase NamZ domain-containing protein [Thermoanaerobaculia bacterium]